MTKFNWQPLQRITTRHSEQTYLERPFRLLRHGVTISHIWLTLQGKDKAPYLAVYTDETASKVAVGFSDSQDENCFAIKRAEAEMRLTRSVASVTLAKTMHALGYPERVNMSLEKLKDNLWLIVKPEGEEAEDGRKSTVQFPKR